MTHVEIIYNPYRETSRILIGGLPVPAHGELGRFQTEPFYRWCDGLTSAISRQVNGLYTLSFISTVIEREIITKLANKAADCQKVEVNSCVVNTPLPSRWAALADVSGCHATFSIYVMTPAGKEFLRNEAKQFTEAAYQNVRTLRSPYTNTDIYFMLGQPPSSADPGTTLCIWLSDSFDEEHQISDSVYMEGKSRAVLSVAFAETEAMGFSHKQGTLYSYNCKPGKLEKLLIHFLDYACVTPLFSVLYKHAAYVASNSGHSPDIQCSLPASVLGIDAVEPVVTVSAPEHLEEGHSIKIAASVYPQSARLPQITYQSIPYGIVHCENDVIQALSAGVATVEAFVSGEPEPFSRFSVRVYRRNRIKHLSLSSYSFDLLTGQKLELAVNWEPADADNIDAMEWSSSSPSCRVQTTGPGIGMITGIRKGEASVSASVEGVSVSAKVRVWPAVEKIHLSANVIELKIGEQAIFDFHYTPTDAYDPQITTVFSDPGVLKFSHGKLLPRRIGETDIIVKSATSGINAVCKVKVNPSDKGKGNKRGCLTVLLVLLFIIVAYFINYFF
jgi:hypothetical protein